MPVSDKKRAANQANSKKSTGPNTNSGKRNSSRNSTRHGVLASVVLIAGESRKRFEGLMNSLIDEFQPQTPTEHALVQKMGVAYWRQLRTWALESASVTREINAQSESTANENPATCALLAYRSLSDDHRQLDLNSRYEHRFDRQHYRALEALTKLRSDRERRKAQADRQIAGAERSHQDDENKGSAPKNEATENPNEPK